MLQKVSLTFVNLNTKQHHQDMINFSPELKGYVICAWVVRLREN